MKISLSIFLLSFITISGFSQIDPVTWSASSEKLEDGNHLINIHAEIEDGWVVYSQHTDPNGPVPTSFEFENQHCLLGEVEEKSESILMYSDLFLVDVIKFKKEAIFVQNINSTCDDQIKLQVEFMTCNGDRCLPPKVVELEVALN